MNKTLLTLLVGIFTQIAISQTLPDGHTVFSYQSGVKASEGTILSGKPEGLWKAYYPSAKLKSEGKRKAGQLDSIWVFYYELGDTLETISYINGIKSGYYVKFRQANDSVPYNYPFSKELYINGQLEGPSVYYYPTGQKWKKIHYEQGKKEGIAYEYGLNGTPITEMRFKHGVIVDKEHINRLNTIGVKVGKWKVYSQNGHTKEEITYKNGKPDGYKRTYDKRGNIVSVALFKEGVVIEESSHANQITEPVEVFYEDGVLKSVGIIKEGVQIGMHRFYRQDGTLSKGVIFTESGVKMSEGLLDSTYRKTGIWQEYYLSGIKKAEGAYANDLKTSKWSYFSENGKLEQKGKFKSGKANGTWVWYFETGEILREEEFYKGKEEGESIEYNKSGNVIVKGSYTEGNREGKWLINTGDHTEKGRYSEGMKTSVWKHFYDNGTLRYEGKYVNDEPNGKHKYYYPNGRLWKEQFYRTGRRIKNWREYNELGEQVLVLSYSSDKLVKINGKKLK